MKDLTIHENVKDIGPGEVSHGNAGFQELKLLVDKYNVDCFALKKDYGKGMIINDYINVHSGDVNW